MNASQEMGPFLVDQGWSERSNSLDRQEAKTNSFASLSAAVKMP